MSQKESKKKFGLTSFIFQPTKKEKSKANPFEKLDFDYQLRARVKKFKPKRFTRSKYENYLRRPKLDKTFLTPEMEKSHRDRINPFNQTVYNPKT